jgi:hypothetical protein
MQAVVVSVALLVPRPAGAAQGIGGQITAGSLAAGAGRMQGVGQQRIVESVTPVTPRHGIGGQGSVTPVATFRPPAW